MKIDFTQTLKGMDEKNIQFNKADEGEKPDMFDVTLGFACISALRFNDPKGNFDGEEKLKHFMIGLRISQAKEPIEMTIEELAMLKELTGKYLSVELAGAAWLALENKDK